MKAISALIISIFIIYSSAAFAFNTGVVTKGGTSGVVNNMPSNLTDAVETSAFPKLFVIVPFLQSVKGIAAQKSLAPQAAKCEKQGSFARGLCLTSMNPKIAAASTAITTLLAAMDASAGQKNACEKFGSAMDIAKAAVTAYTTACGAARMVCTMSCETLARNAASQASALRAAAGAAGVAPQEATLMTADATKLETWVNSELRVPDISKSVIAQCDKYKLKLAAGAMGLMNIVQSAKGGDKCEDQLTAGAGDGSLDCSKPENTEVVECKCRLNPTLPGCAGGGNANNDPYQNAMSEYSDAEGNVDAGGNVDLSSSPAADANAAFSSADSSGGAGGFPGSGGGAGGIGANGTGKAADGGGGSGKGLNKNILSGYEGGSGGGGGGGGYADNAYADQYKAFMPGGAKDPARDPANVKFAGGQLTGSGGKSNWEKVSERYQANRPKMFVGGP